MFCSWLIAHKSCLPLLLSYLNAQQKLLIDVVKLPPVILNPVVSSLTKLLLGTPKLIRSVQKLPTTYLKLHIVVLNQVSSSGTKLLHRA